MKEILKLDLERRKRIFEVAAREMRVNPVVIEKDFWVCFVLNHLMNESPYKDYFIFKGGTSLSKCYHIIKRFSEDVDLVLKWDSLGFTDEEVYKDRSKNQNYKFEMKMNERGAFFIQNNIKNDLIENLIKKVEGLTISSDEKDPMILYVNYPHEGTDQYIKQSIKLEIGPVAAKTPVEKKTISPYYCDYFNLDGDDKAFEVSVVSLARTFWEKLLILYSETNRPIDKKIPSRYLRHYYDVSMIYKSAFFKTIVEQKNLFEEVKAFKNKYYHSDWSKIQECNLSSITIYPPEYRINELKKDYKNMTDMFFEDIPSFEEILNMIKCLEKELRQS